LDVSVGQGLRLDIGCLSQRGRDEHSAQDAKSRQRFHTVSPLDVEDALNAGVPR
jgi:hypothetical protein